MRSALLFLLLVSLAKLSFGIGNIQGTTHPVTEFICGTGGGSFPDGPAGSATAACSITAARLSTSTQVFCSALGMGVTQTNTYSVGDVLSPTAFWLSLAITTSCPGGNSTNPHAQAAAWTTTTVQVLGCADPNSSLIAGTACTCNVGFKPNSLTTATSCQPYVCPAGKPLGDSAFGPYGSRPPVGTPVYVCDNVNGTAGVKNPSYGCGTTATIYAAGEDSANGYWAWAHETSNSLQCQADGGNPPGPGNPASGAASSQNGGLSPPVTACAAGTCPGTTTIGGVTQNVCVACSWTEGQTSSAASAPSGAASAPVGTTPGTQATTITCQNGICTVQTTTTDPNGNVIAITSTQGSAAAVCAANAGSPACAGTAASGVTGGTGGGGGSGTGTGCDEADAGGCAGNGAGIASLYTGKGRTFAQVLADRQSQFSGTSLASGTSGFFTVTSGGTCPAPTLSLAFFNASYTIDQLCSSAAATLYAIVSGVVLLVCGFFAFRVAFL